MTPAELIDLPAFLRRLRAERHPSLVVHGPALCGKSAFARKLAAAMGWGYLDVLAAVAERPELSTHIDQFDHLALYKLLRAKTVAVDTLLVDEMDFLFPLWGDLLPFKEMVRVYTGLEQQVCVAFFVQSHPEWNNWELLTAERISRVVEFESIKPL